MFCVTGSAAIDVPRMLHAKGMDDHLERYVINASSPELTRWWARYCESSGEFEKALHGYQVRLFIFIYVWAIGVTACVLYQAAGDFLSLVRTYCAQGDYEVAASLVEESGDPAAAFHLARTFEAMDEHAEAIRFFGLAGRSVSFYLSLHGQLE